jgi:hypothetical protein
VKFGKFLELAANAMLSHEKAFPEEMREILTSNRIVNGKNLQLKPRIAFQEVINRFENANCDQQRDGPRTLDRLWESLTRLNSLGQLPDVTKIGQSRDLMVQSIAKPFPKRPTYSQHFLKLLKN